MNTSAKNYTHTTLIVSGIFALILMCSFIADASNYTNLNETIDSTENTASINLNYTIHDNISSKYNSQLTNNNTNISINIVTKSPESSTNIFDIKMNILNQIIQLIIFILTIIMAVNIATYQILEPKFHQLFKTLMFKKTRFLILAGVLLLYFGILTYNFFIIPTNTILAIEFIVLLLLIIILIHLFYKLIYYSNKSSLTVSYLDSLNNCDIFTEICNKYGYPNEEHISDSRLILKSLFSDNAAENDYSVAKENAELNRTQIILLNEKIKNYGNESDIESIFDILALMIEKSEYKFFHKHIDKVHEILFSILKDKNLNCTIRENIIYFLIENYDKLIKKSMDKEYFEYYVLLIEAHEKLGKILIDVEDFESVKTVVDQIGKYSFDINRKIFHIDYSYKASDSIFNLINYYIDKETYKDNTVQKWLEIIGAIAEDITEIDYIVKYRSIRIDYTLKTVSDSNPVYRIINNLNALNNKVIKNIKNTTDISKNGQNVIETISIILRNITFKLLEKNDYSVTYDIYQSYEKMTTESINNEVYYALHYIIQDLHKIGHEIINKEWKNNADSILFTIAKLGTLAENKKMTHPKSQQYFFHDFAKILKYLFIKFMDTFGEEPYIKQPNDFFHELSIHHNSEEFKQFYDSCEPNESIISNIKEEP